MRRPVRDVATVTTVALIGTAVAVGGGGDGVAVAAWTGSGALLGLIVVAAGIRPLVALPVVLGGGAGALIGFSVARILCRPGSCRQIEFAAGLLTGIGALVGTAVVVALATRSLDEYRRAVERNQPPPEPGCEANEHPV